MNRKETTYQISLLTQPVISPQIPAEMVYQAACIGAVTLLYEDGNDKALSAMVLHAAAPESRIRALTALESLTRAAEPIRSNATHQLYELAILHNQPQAIDFIRKSGLQDVNAGWNSARMLLFEQKHQLLKTDPGPEKLTKLFLSADPAFRQRLLDLSEKTLPNWNTLMRYLNEPSAVNHQAIITAYKNFTPEEQQLLHFCADQADTSSLPADILLRYEDSTALELCLVHDLHPSDSSQEALFYFLSGQWDRYYQADSDYRRIRLAYEGKDPELQRRLIAISRDSGNNAWLQYIRSSIDNIPHSGSLADQHLLVSSLIEQKQWGRLWEILPNVPLLCMPAICEALEKAHQKPSRIEEVSFLHELEERIRACQGLSPIPLCYNFQESTGTVLGLCAGGNHFAVLYTDRRILVWDQKEPEAGPLIISSNQLSFRKITLSHDGKYLCTDSGNGTLSIFSLPSGQTVKTIHTDGSAIAGIFLQPDDRRLILLGQNGKGGVFTFPGGAELFRFDIGQRDCYRSAYDAASNRFCGITLDGNCTLFDINEKKVVTNMKIADTPTAISEMFSSGKLSCITQDATLSCINLLSGKHTLDKHISSSEKIRKIIEINHGDLYVLGTLSGKILVFDPTTEETIAVLHSGAKSAVAGLWYNQDTAILYACTANGTVRSWDLNLFHDMIRILPLLQLPGFSRIEEFRKKYPEPGVKAAAEWLKTVIAWRRRFDIEIDFE